MVARYDNITIKAELSKDGWIVDKPVITRAGIFTYHDSKGNVIREYRPEAEVFKEDSLRTLRGIPITDGHKGILNTNSNLDGIIVGSVMSAGERADNNVVADVVIHNVKKIGSKRELSLGYQCMIDETPGEFNGQRYDQTQTDITYNHLAVVNKGRAGNARIRLDSNECASFDTEDDMAEVTLPKLRFDNGLEYSASPEVIVQYGVLKDSVKDLQTRLDKAEGERDAAKAALDKANKDHTEALAKERDSARSRLVLEEKAKQLDMKFDGLSDRELKMLIANKLGNKLEFKDRSDEYVDSVYDVLVAQDADKNKSTSRQKDVMIRKDSAAGAGTSSSSLDARARMIARIRGETPNKKDAA